MISLSDSSLIQQWETLKRAISDERTVFRDACETRLIAVSKTHPAETVMQLLQAGQVDFGENRVQEAAAKWAPLQKSFPQARLHLIGPLQTNKAVQALALFDVIHTVDRMSLVDALLQDADKAALARKAFLIQVNIGEEPQKAGVRPVELAQLLEYSAAKGLIISGLMCIPPAGRPPAPHFALLQKLAERHGLKELSMGMSDDFKTAVRFGATYVRVGTALFGRREG